jgi:uncharacterized DUF497 family protein
VRIYELIVEPGREEHIARHHVAVEEVEEVVFTPSFVRRARHGYLRLIGQTAAGRYLAVFVVRRTPGVYSLVTARDATEGERREYLRHTRH